MCGWVQWHLLSFLTFVKVGSFPLWSGECLETTKTAGIWNRNFSVFSTCHSCVVRLQSAAPFCSMYVTGFLRSVVSHVIGCMHSVPSATQWFLASYFQARKADWFTVLLEVLKPCFGTCIVAGNRQHLTVVVLEVPHDGWLCKVQSTLRFAVGQY